MNTTNSNPDFNEDNELENISPALFNLQKTNSAFKEPEGYFEKFNENIFRKIKEEESKKPKGIIRTLFQPRYAIAASILAAVSIMGISYYNNLQPLKMPTKSEIAEVVFSDKIENIDEDVLIEELGADEINSNEMIDEDTISNEAIINYLIENNVDINYIN